MGKKYIESAKLIDKSALYNPVEALDLTLKTAKANFDETVELHVRLGVDPRHADQQVRATVVLPHGTGKTKKILVFARGEKGGEQLTEVKVGGTKGKYSDSDTAWRGNLVLTTEWQKYSISLKGKNLSRIVNPSN